MHLKTEGAGPSRPGNADCTPCPRDQQILNVIAFLARERSLEVVQLSKEARRTAMWAAFRLVSCEPADLARVFARHLTSVYRDLAHVDAVRRRDAAYRQGLDALLVRADRALGLEG